VAIESLFKKKIKLLRARPSWAPLKLFGCQSPNPTTQPKEKIYI
jgi:hypothetical protein